MSDIISRKAAIEALKEHRNLFCDNTPETFSVLPYGDKCRVDELDMAIATLINLPPAQPDCADLFPDVSEEYKKGYRDGLRDKPEPHWIPVTERLPDEDGLYLVTTSKGQAQVHVFSHNGNSEEYWMRCNKAWMPLPEPYREEGEK